MNKKHSIIHNMRIKSDVSVKIGIAVVILAVSMLMAVGTTFARIKFDYSAQMDFDPKASDVIYISSEKGLQKIDNNTYSIDFSVKNGISTSDRAKQDLYVSLELAATNPDLGETSVSLSLGENKFGGFPARIPADSLLEKSFGEGYSYSFCDLMEEEAEIVLSGKELSSENATLSISNAEPGTIFSLVARSINGRTTDSVETSLSFRIPYNINGFNPVDWDGTVTLDNLNVLLGNIDGQVVIPLKGLKLENASLLISDADWASASLQANSITINSVERKDTSDNVIYRPDHVSITLTQQEENGVKTTVFHIERIDATPYGTVEVKNQQGWYNRFVPLRLKVGDQATVCLESFTNNGFPSGTRYTAGAEKYLVYNPQPLVLPMNSVVTLDFSEVSEIESKNINIVSMTKSTLLEYKPIPLFFDTEETIIIGDELIITSLPYYCGSIEPSFLVEKVIVYNGETDTEESENISCTEDSETGCVKLVVNNRISGSYIVTARWTDSLGKLYSVMIPVCIRQDAL